MKQYIINISLILLTTSLFGCSTPSFTTKVYDESYKEKFTTLDMLIIRGSFPKAKNYLTQSPVEDINWYKEIGAKIEENFQHNGINISYKVLNNISNAHKKRSKNTPALIIYPYTVLIQHRTNSVSLGVRASLYAPNRKRPIWVAVTGISPYRAADELSLKILNELSKLKLISLNKEKAETVDGKKSSTFGGVLTK